IAEWPYLDGTDIPPGEGEVRLVSELLVLEDLNVIGGQQMLANLVADRDDLGTRPGYGGEPELGRVLQLVLVNVRVAGQREARRQGLGRGGGQVAGTLRDVSDRSGKLPFCLEGV